ncbi:hypothetical protein [Bacteroides sp.]
MKKILLFSLSTLLWGQLGAQEIIPETMKAISNPQEIEITVNDDWNRAKNGKVMVKLPDGSLIFPAISESTGEELYICRNEQIQLIKDIVPGSSGSNPQWMTVVDDKVYFTATTPETGQELWITDGTANGTRLVKDIYEGDLGSDLFGLTAFNGKCLFFAKDIDSELEPIIDSQVAEEWLWISDGSEEGTVRIADVPTRKGVDNPDGYLIPSGDKVFFIGYHREYNETLWITDGTPNGTKAIKDIYPVALAGSTFQTEAASIDWLTNIKNDENDKLVVFRANTLDDTGKKIGSEIWYSNGTPEGTKWVGKDYNPGDKDGVPNNTEFAFPKYYKGKVYFRAKDGVHGCEPGVTDFTPEGTHYICDINHWNNDPQCDSWGPEYSYIWNDYLFCQASGSYYYPADTYRDSSYSLWRYNLNEGGVTPTKENGLIGFQYQANWTNGVEIFPGNNPDGPRWFTACGGRLYFRAQDLVGNWELWMMDTVDSTPTKVSDMEGNSTPHHLTDVNNSLYFITTTTKTLYKYSPMPTGLSQTKVGDNNLTINYNRISGKIELTSSTEIAEVKAFSLDGKQILSLSGNHDQIDVSNWEDGVYIVFAKDISGNTTTSKLIK